MQLFYEEQEMDLDVAKSVVFIVSNVVLALVVTAMFVTLGVGNDCNFLVFFASTWVYVVAIEFIFWCIIAGIKLTIKAFKTAVKLT